MGDIAHAVYSTYQALPGLRHIVSYRSNGTITGYHDSSFCHIYLLFLESAFAKRIFYLRTAMPEAENYNGINPDN
jgi:hypothetical protein